MKKQMTVREWIAKFNAKEFVSKDYGTQCEAGWYDWWCRDTSLAGKTATMGSIIHRITNPAILDGMYVFFKNNCPMNGPLYDQFKFCNPETGDVVFCVNIDCIWDSKRYTVYQAPSWETESFATDSAKELIAWFNGLKL